MAIQESGQMYLETILILTNKSQSVRAIDIGEEMNFSKPSVSRAIHLLEKQGMVSIDGQGFITLTDPGREIAESIYSRHQVLSKFFMSIGVDEDVAVNDACRVEHYISEETFSALKRYIEKNEAGRN